MKREVIRSDRAPAAIGPYSQAVRVGDFVFLSGQIGLDPASGELAAGGIEAETRRVFENLSAVAAAAGATLGDVVKLTVYLLDFGDYAAVNEIMTGFFEAPYPARAAVGVAALPRGARVEVDAIIAR
ncbi:MAG: RidA family protein [Gammaproteobacteria bacterium]